jgi:hypothetical protein
MATTAMNAMVARTAMRAMIANGVLDLPRSRDALLAERRSPSLLPQRRRRRVRDLLDRAHDHPGAGLGVNRQEPLAVVRERDALVIAEPPPRGRAGGWSLVVDGAPEIGGTSRRRRCIRSSSETRRSVRRRAATRRSARAPCVRAGYTTPDRAAHHSPAPLDVPRSDRADHPSVRITAKRAERFEGRGRGRRPRRLRVRTPGDGEAQNRTGDTTIFSRVLYQLSYLAD